MSGYIKEFILLAVCMTLIVGTFMSLFITNLIAENAHPVIKRIVGVIIAITIGCAIGGMLTLENKNNDNAWNNGYCIECNEPYRFVGATYHKNGIDEYYYTCDNCGHTISINTLKER